MKFDTRKPNESRAICLTDLGTNRRRGFSAERHEYRMQLARDRQEREFYEFIMTAPAGAGECYFIGCDDDLVKIGFSRSVGQRMARLQSMAGHGKLTLLVTCGGGRAAEMHYHRKFREHAVGNEWFRLHPDIRAEIDLLLRARPMTWPCVRKTEMRRFARVVAA